MLDTSQIQTWMIWKEGSLTTTMAQGKSILPGLICYLFIDLCKPRVSGRPISHLINVWKRCDVIIGMPREVQLKRWSHSYESEMSINDKKADFGYASLHNN